MRVPQPTWDGRKPLCPLRAVDAGTSQGTWMRPSALWAPPQSLTSQVLVQTLVHRVAVADVLAAIAALARGLVAGAGGAVPGTVGIPGQAAFSTSCAIGLTLVQPYLGHPQAGTHVERLLGKQHGDGDAGSPCRHGAQGHPPAPAGASTMQALRGW